MRPVAALRPLGSECLVRVFFLDTLETAQQMVLATTVPVERVQDRSVEIRHAVEAFLHAPGLQPLSIQLEVLTTEFMPFEATPHHVARCWNFQYGAERRCIRLPSSTG